MLSGRRHRLVEMGMRRPAVVRRIAGAYIAGRTWLARRMGCNYRTRPAALVARRVWCVAWCLWTWVLALAAWSASWTVSSLVAAGVWVVVLVKRRMRRVVLDLLDGA